MPDERLQKVLARAGVASRRASERLIEAGRVRVNGAVVERLGTRVDPERDRILVDGRPLGRRPARPVYLMLHKPKGYVTTASDPEGRPTVLDLVRGVPGRIFPVGRLDYHSEGLLLLTDDGGLAHRLTHPSSEIERTYAVKVRGCPDEATLRRLARGVRLDGRPTAPARLRLVQPGSNSWLEVTVTEGRHHHVRRLLRAGGHPVLKLRRTRYDGVHLGQLPRGAFRKLRPDEIARLRRAGRGASEGGVEPS